MCFSIRPSALDSHQVVRGKGWGHNITCGDVTYAEPVSDFINDINITLDGTNAI